MEKIQFDYSMKNIPIPSRAAYTTNLLEKVESVIKRMRWKAYFFLNPTNNHQPNKFNIKSRRCPPPIEELKPFEDDMFKMIEGLKFKVVKNHFQDKLKQDIKMINSSNKAFVFADKTRNIYKLDKEQYDKVLRENISKCYKKSDLLTLNSVICWTLVPVADEFEFLLETAKPPAATCA